MSAGYIDTTFITALGSKLIGFYWFNTYKVYEKRNGKAQLVLCHKSKFSTFTIRNRNRKSSKANEK